MAWLPWNYGAALGVLFLFVFLLVRGKENRRWLFVSSFSAEASVLSFLYAIWVLGGKLSGLELDGAIGRGEWLWDVERALGLPNEKTWQEALTPHSYATQAANLYYFIAHVPAMGIFLFWLFIRHRSKFPKWRNTLALLTGASLSIQLIPVAPPRLVSSLGIIDTGLAYDQSVYGTLGYTIAGQLQAMPSIHVGWAALIGWATALESTSYWRWLGVLHTVATMYVVVVTGNHFWLDGIVAVILLGMLYPVAKQIADVSARLLHKEEPKPVPRQTPELA